MPARARRTRRAAAVGLGDSGNRVDGSGAGVDGSAVSWPNRVWSSHESLDDPSASSQFARNSGSSLSRSFRFVKYSGIRVQCLWWIWIVGYRCVASYHERVLSATTRRGLRQRAWYFVGGLALCAVLAGSATVLPAPVVRTRRRTSLASQLVARGRRRVNDGLSVLFYGIGCRAGYRSRRLDQLTRRSVRIR